MTLRKRYEGQFSSKVPMDVVGLDMLPNKARLVNNFSATLVNLQPPI